MNMIMDKNDRTSKYMAMLMWPCLGENDEEFLVLYSNNRIELMKRVVEEMTNSDTHELLFFGERNRLIEREIRATVAQIREEYHKEAEERRIALEKSAKAVREKDQARKRDVGYKLYLMLKKRFEGGEEE